MLIKIISEYDCIFLYSDRPIDVKKLTDLKNEFDSAMIQWKVARDLFIQREGIEKNLAARLDDYQYFYQQDPNPFIKKRVEEFERQWVVLSDRDSLHPAPYNTIVDRFVLLGFKQLKDARCDLLVTINTDSVNKSAELVVKVGQHDLPHD
jgi:hypothetical protein